MKDKDYFSHLYDISSHLNKEFSIQAALRKSLEKTVEILGLETGWIWLTEPNNKSVYLAASHNLPPALANFPERLSGWCYCIKQYLSDDINQAMNISEIVCSRLKDLGTGTNDLKFHATIPIIIDREKVGLINLLSKETRKLNEKELTILNTISELIGTAIQRTRLQGTLRNDHPTETNIDKLSQAVIFPKIESIVACLQSAKSESLKIKLALQKTVDLQNELKTLLGEMASLETKSKTSNAFNYPQMPITKRELQVLKLMKQGLTNEQIGQQLFITERTVKFHITAILSKLHANNRTEAVDIALKRGLLSL